MTKKGRLVFFRGMKLLSTVTVIIQYAIFFRFKVFFFYWFEFNYIQLPIDYGLVTCTNMRADINLITLQRKFLICK